MAFKRHLSFVKLLMLYLFLETDLIHSENVVGVQDVHRYPLFICRNGRPELIKKRKLQDRQIHLNLNYGTNKPLLVNETIGQKQRLRSRAFERSRRSIPQCLNSMEFHYGAALRALSHRCMENALGER